MGYWGSLFYCQEITRNGEKKERKKATCVAWARSHVSHGGGGSVVYVPPCCCCCCCFKNWNTRPDAMDGWEERKGRKDLRHSSGCKGRHMAVQPNTLTRIIIIIITKVLKMKQFPIVKSTLSFFLLSQHITTTIIIIIIICHVAASSCRVLIASFFFFSSYKK